MQVVRVRRGRSLIRRQRSLQRSPRWQWRWGWRRWWYWQRGVLSAEAEIPSDQTYWRLFKIWYLTSPQTILWTLLGLQTGPWPVNKLFPENSLSSGRKRVRSILTWQNRSRRSQTFFSQTLALSKIEAMEFRNNLSKQCFDTVGWALGVRKSIWPVKIEWWGVGVVICLEWGADCLHMVQLMLLQSPNPSSLASFKSRVFYLSGTSLLRLTWKRGC